MFAENVEALRRAFEAFHRRDKDAWLDLNDPELEIEPVGDWPEAPEIRGPEAAWEFLVATDEPWESSPFQLSEVADAGNEQVVARQRRQLRGKASRVVVEYDYWLLVGYRSGKAIRVQWFESRDDALKEAERRRASGRAL